MTQNRLRNQLAATLLLSALIASDFTLVEPLKSAASNWGEIAIGFDVLLARLAAPFALAFLAIAMLAVPLAAIAPRGGVSALVAVYFALWAQGNLFVWEYGAFDGSPIDWREHSGKGLLEIGVWLGAFALALARADWVRRNALRVAAFVFALQIASLAGQIKRHAPFPRAPAADAEVVHSEGSTDLLLIRSLAGFSTDLNVIVIVLDTFQSDFFSEALRDAELRASMPPGFTYYRNASSLYYRTEFSIQSILSSRAVPDSVDIRKWRNKQVDNTLPATLSELGFDTVLMTVIKGQYKKFESWKWPRVLGEAVADVGFEDTAWREDVSNLFAVGLFRLTPHFLKPQIYDQGDWQVRRLYPPRDRRGRDPNMHWGTRTDLGVFDELIASASPESGVPRFRLLHFWGIHLPYVVNERCEYAGPGAFERKEAIEVSRCILSRLFAFLTRLDEIGVYDKSLIFVVGDHGSTVKIDLSVASPPLPESPVMLGSAADPSEPGVSESWWRGVPLFLAKPIDDRQPLRISDQPVSLCDVPSSVVDALAIEGDFECESIFSQPDPRRTPRLHYRYPDTGRPARSEAGSRTAVRCVSGDRTQLASRVVDSVASRRGVTRPERDEQIREGGDAQ